ncbi:hypothetical protein [Bradyrhizobium forestalis]|uniref:hypothetical protein n=1 Tax=Bradyrhizobium forestalis TaxID=1419263 RepID=UPI0011AF3ACC|nr:hypothetical protein [Bradyrhizobium forestalis]
MIILVSIVDLTGLSGGRHPQLQLYRFRRFEVQTRPIAVHARKVFHAKRLCRLIRNCGVNAHGSFQTVRREVCVAKTTSALHLRRVASTRVATFPDTTLVLDAEPFGFLDRRDQS